jgi:hypothetical protein
MFAHHDHLQRLAHEQQDLLAHLTTALVAQDMNMASIDLSKAKANAAEIQRIAAVAASGDSAAIQAAVAAQLESDQAASDAQAEAEAADIAPLTAQFPPPVAATPLSVSPTSLTSAVGATISDTLTVAGGTEPYAAVSSLADVSVSVSGTSVSVSGTPGAAETGTITISDAASSTPVVADVTIA